MARNPKKGIFTHLGLPISKKYIYPPTRHKMILIGGIGAGAVLLFFLFNAFFLHNSFISAGPLSSNHATLENNCGACHDQLKSVTDNSCSSCHDLQGSKGRVFDFSAHYIYLTNDPGRRKTGKEKFESKEMSCIACHNEHLGRDAHITEVSQAQCSSCHGFGSLNNHPEFEFARTKMADDASIEFTHVAHIKGYIGGKNPNQTCATCHQLQPDGRHFQAINFQNHCMKCHTKQLGGFRHEDERALQSRKADCTICHQTSGRSVLPVQGDQRVLFRTEFDHGTHTLLADCLDCHREIPIIKEIKNPISSDQAATLNIPKIDSCKSCHNSSLTSNQCVTCHEFHPNKALRFTLE